MCVWHVCVACVFVYECEFLFVCLCMTVCVRTGPAGHSESKQEGVLAVFGFWHLYSAGALNGALHTRELEQSHSVSGL